MRKNVRNEMFYEKYVNLLKNIILKAKRMKGIEKEKRIYTM